MNRLTYKLNAEEQKEYRSRYIQFEYLPIPDYDIKRGNYDRISTDMIYNKLGRLEDLEEQIGCPLDVAVKALLNGVYESYTDYGDNNSIKIRHRKVRGIERDGLSVINTICGSPECDDWFEYKDYKKTWFLKKDKSE
jgi:hypothetical protein